MKKLIALTVASGISAGAIAASETGWVHVTELGSGWGNLRTNIYVEDEIYNPAGCVNPHGYQVNEDAINGDRIFTLALAAFAAQKEVKITIDDEVCSNNGNPKVLSIRLR